MHTGFNPSKSGYIQQVNRRWGAKIETEKMVESVARRSEMETQTQTEKQTHDTEHGASERARHRQTDTDTGKRQDVRLAIRWMPVWCDFGWPEHA